MLFLKRAVFIPNDHTTLVNPTIHHECVSNKIALNLFIPLLPLFHFFFSFLSLFLSSFPFTFPLQPRKITSHFESVFPHPQSLPILLSFSLLHFLLFYLFSPSPFSRSIDLSFFLDSTAPCIFLFSLLISVLNSFSFHIFCLFFSLSACLRKSNWWSSIAFSCCRISQSRLQRSFSNSFEMVTRREIGRCDSSFSWELSGLGKTITLAIFQILEK